MNAQASISVIICTWNRAGSLAETLASLQQQEGIDPGTVEVIVVDNNSTDATRSVFEAAAAGWRLGTLRYSFERRQGKQFALNTGLQLASHDILAFTDDDIIFPHDWLQKIHDLFARSATELAGGRTLLRWPPEGPPRWFASEMMAILAGVDLGDRPLLPAPAEYAPAGSNLIAKRQLFERHGVYSESHFRHMDHEFGVRCNRAGAKVAYEPSLQVFAPVDPNCLNKRYFRRWSWKAGIAITGGIEATRQPAKTPRWLFRQALEDLVYLTTWGVMAAPAARFQRELRMWRCLGGIANVWHARRHPATHSQWVERFSQKKNNKTF